jgi:MarR family transcriptional regulator for hemolysin
MGKPTNIGYRVGILSRLFLKRINEKMLSTGLTGSQWSVIRQLLISGSLTQTEICKHLSIEASTGSTMIHTMENIGWINRSADERDKREKKVTLTDKSQKLIPIWLQISEELQHSALGSIPTEDVEIFERVLDQIVLNMRSAEK